MPIFIATVETRNAATEAKMETLHWFITARDLGYAEKVTANQIENTNRTIPSVVNTLIKIEPFNNQVCWYRNICLGHPFVTPLKQERGGNEGKQ